MHHWNEIEHAAADRHAQALRDGRDAHLLRAARDDQQRQPHFARVAAAIHELLHRSRDRWRAPSADAVDSARVKR